MRSSSIALASLAAAVLAGCVSNLQGTSSMPSSPAVPDSAGRQLAHEWSGRSSVKERVIHTFTDAEGFFPQAGLLDVNGTFYGTTFQGGGYGSEGPGTVFKIKPSGKVTVLYNFDGAVGGNSIASLIKVNGKFYGTTLYGASGYGGTAFSLTQSGTLTTLHEFPSYSTDGVGVRGALFNLSGTLYGTTCAGGAHGYGTVFSITTTGHETVLHSFSGSDGACPSAALIEVNGTLYGTTSQGGSSNDGTVFSVTTSGSEEVLHSFSGAPDGSGPVAALTAVNGTMYGTTGGGGLKSCGDSGCGTVFSIDLSGSEKVVYRFAGSPDGSDPQANLLNVNGTLYGTTAAGGKRCEYFGTCGTVFSITTSGQEQVLYRFKGDFHGHSDGNSPLSGLIDFKGKLYGTTSAGGAGFCLSDSSGCGTVFAIHL